MDVVFSFDMPPLHALVVNFPFALLLIALLSAFIWALRGRRFWRMVTFFLTGLGALGSIAALFTGRALKEEVVVRPVVDAVVDYHESFALYTVIASVVTTLFLAAMTFYLERRTTIQRHPPDPAWIRTVGFLLVLVTAGLCAWTAHMGAVMVWNR
jgi:uncharacterized membrane protein